MKITDAAFGIGGPPGVQPNANTPLGFLDALVAAMAPAADASLSGAAIDANDPKASLPPVMSMPGTDTPVQSATSPAAAPLQTPAVVPSPVPAAGADPLTQVEKNVSAPADLAQTPVPTNGEDIATTAEPVATATEQPRAAQANANPLQQARPVKTGKPQRHAAAAALEKQPSTNTAVETGSPAAAAAKTPVETAARDTTADTPPDSQQQQQVAATPTADATMLAAAAAVVAPVAAPAPNKAGVPSAASRTAGAVTRASRSGGTNEASATDTASTGSRSTERTPRNSGSQFQAKLGEAETGEAPAGKLGEHTQAHVEAAVLPTSDAPRPAAHAASNAGATTTPAMPAEPTVSARHGEIGRALGVEVARRVSEGGEELRVRLNPAEFGRIEVKISFDDGGTLRATVHAENPAALDMLRRDSADLGQALGDAGVRADAQSFRFESRADGQDRQQQQQQAQRQSDFGGSNPFADEPLPEAALAAYRPVRTPGRVDLLA